MLPWRSWCVALQGNRGEEWMQQFFPKKSFSDSYDGLVTIRRGEGPPEQVNVARPRSSTARAFRNP